MSGGETGIVPAGPPCPVHSQLDLGRRGRRPSRLKTCFALGRVRGLADRRNQRRLSRYLEFSPHGLEHRQDVVDGSFALNHVYGVEYVSVLSRQYLDPLLDLFPHFFRCAER